MGPGSIVKPRLASRRLASLDRRCQPCALPARDAGDHFWAIIVGEHRDLVVVGESRPAARPARCRHAPCRGTPCCCRSPARRRGDTDRPCRPASSGARCSRTPARRAQVMPGTSLPLLSLHGEGDFNRVHANGRKLIGLRTDRWKLRRRTLLLIRHRWRSGRGFIKIRLVRIGSQRAGRCPVERRRRALARSHRAKASQLRLGRIRNLLLLLLRSIRQCGRRRLLLGRPAAPPAQLPIADAITKSFTGISLTNTPGTTPGKLTTEYQRYGAEARPSVLFGRTGLCIGCP